jgi:hypothetical protein
VGVGEEKRREERVGGIRGMIVEDGDERKRRQKDG